MKTRGEKAKGLVKHLALKEMHGRARKCEALQARCDSIRIRCYRESHPNIPEVFKRADKRRRNIMMSISSAQEQFHNICIN